MANEQTGMTSLAEQSAALRQEIVAELQSGKLTGTAEGDGDDSAADESSDPKEGDESTAKSDDDKSGASDDSDDGESSDGSDGDESDDGEGEGEGEGDDESDHEVDIDAALAAGKAGDREALEKALGLTEGTLSSAKEHKALRIQRRKAEQKSEKADRLEKELIERFSDPALARAEIGRGNVQPLLDHLAKVADMDWTELNKLVLDHVQGKTPEDLEQRRRLRQLERESQERKKQDEESAKERDREEKVRVAKDWISTEISKDPLAKHPQIVDLVYAKMQKLWNQGVTEPSKALELVRGDLAEQAKVLERVGVIKAQKKAKKAAKPAVSRDSARKDALAGNADPKNAKPTTSAEIRKQVLQEAGLWREGMQ